MKHPIIILFFIVSTTFGYDLQYHPFLLQVKDKHGVTLAKTLDKVYGDKISVKNKRCYFFELTRDADIEYEIDKCRIDYRVPLKIHSFPEDGLICRFQA